MPQTEELKERLRINRKRRTSSIVTFVIVNLWAVAVLLYLQLPVIMVYTVMTTAFLLAARLKRLERQRIKLEAEILVSESSFNEDLAIIWQSYMDVRVGHPGDRLQRTPDREGILETEGNQNNLTDSDESEREATNPSPEGHQHRPRGPHLGRPVRPAQHPGFAFEMNDFADGGELPVIFDDEENRSGRIEIYRRDFRDFNVVCFNRVNEFLQVC